MKLSIVLATFGLSSAMVMPAESDHDLVARALPKLNQYRTMDDCIHDRNILYHAAPTLGNCYPLDDKTGAFFYNTAGFLGSYASKDVGCGTDDIGLRGGHCMNKDQYRSVVMR